MPVIPATQVAEAGKSLETEKQKLQWAEIMPPHSSLGKRAKLHLKKKKKSSDLMRLIHYHENNLGETAPVIQLSPTGSFPQHMGIMGATIQEEIWVET